MVKIERIITRCDGSAVKIVGEEFKNFRGHYDSFFYAFRRESPGRPWKLLSDRPHPNWRSMSVDEYVKHGRSELHQAVRHSEMISVAMELRALWCEPESLAA